MNNHLNMLPKQAKFDLKCSKMRWRLYMLRPRSRRVDYGSSKPRNREGQTPHITNSWLRH